MLSEENINSILIVKSGQDIGLDLKISLLMISKKCPSILIFHFIGKRMDKQ